MYPNFSDAICFTRFGRSSPIGPTPAAREQEAVVTGDRLLERRTSLPSSEVQVRKWAQIISRPEPRD